MNLLIETITNAKLKDSLAAISKADSISNQLKVEANIKQNEVTANKEAVSETNSTQTPVTKKKKGWNNKQKGAVIGASAGAITGAIVSKKKVKGAIVGGVVGAGVGVGVGAIIDNKEKNN